MAMNATRFRGCDRGVFGLGTWDPPRRPYPETLQQLGVNVTCQQRTDQPDNIETQPPMEESSDTKIQIAKDAKRVPMLAKYTYTANKATPLGHELNVTQGENLQYVKEHDENDNWWLAENATGDLGYVPASYMLKLEERPSNLPWLKKPEPEEPEKSGNNVFGEPQKPVFKPYKSAYASNGEVKTGTKEYYCDVCAKQLNGPKPYGAHMMSKAHKEELELQAEYARDQS